MVAGQVHYSDIVLILVAMIVVNWVFNNAQGSVLIVMLLHAANNTVSGSFSSPMFSGADSLRNRGCSHSSGALWRCLSLPLQVRRISRVNTTSKKNRRLTER